MLPGPLPGPPSSSEEMAKRGISMMAEQQRLLTVSGGLESLSVWEDSETDRRFLRLDMEGNKRTFSITDFRRNEDAAVVTYISGDPTSQDRSLDFRPPRLSRRSLPSSLRLRLVGGGVLFSSWRERRSMLL